MTRVCVWSGPVWSCGVWRWSMILRRARQLSPEATWARIIASFLSGTAAFIIQIRRGCCCWCWVQRWTVALNRTETRLFADSDEWHCVRKIGSRLKRNDYNSSSGRVFLHKKDVRSSSNVWRHNHWQERT